MRCCWRGRLGEWPFFFAAPLASCPWLLPEELGELPSCLPAAATFVSFALHECVHALFFKVFGPSGSHVTFGWNLGVAMIYACAEGIVYSRERYLAIVLAPTIIVTGAAFALGAFSGYSLASWVVCVLHLSGCTGDWFYARAIVSDPRIRWCEDEVWGVRFYGEEEGEGNDCE